jgi:glycosyltransferase involved in cell wall biosynthesis
VRDLWPDAFFSFVPRPLKILARAFLYGMYRQTRRALRRCDAIVGVSQSYLERGLFQSGRARRPSDAVFPLGYERASPSRHELEAAEKNLRRRGVDPSRVICWFIGTFGRTYDLETVIEAARMLHEKNDNRAQFVLSGEGGNVEACRKLASGLDNVVFTGWLDSSGIEWMMRTAGIGLAAYAPGAPQGLPNKLFEYLSAGLPILSSLVPEARALLEAQRCGVTYTAGDPLSFLNAVVSVLDNPETLSGMSEAAHTTFEDNFSIERVYVPFLDYLERFTTPEVAAGRTIQ